MLKPWMELRGAPLSLTDETRDLAVAFLLHKGFQYLGDQYGEEHDHAHELGAASQRAKEAPDFGALLQIVFDAGHLNGVFACHTVLREAWNKAGFAMVSDAPKGE